MRNGFDIGGVVLHSYLSIWRNGVNRMNALENAAAIGAPLVICQDPPAGWEFDGKPQPAFVIYRRAIPAGHVSSNMNGSVNAFRASWYRVTWQDGFATSQAGGGYIRRHATLADAFAFVVAGLV